MPPNDDWMNVPLGAFTTLQRGHDLPEHQRRAGSIPVMGSFGITGWHDEAKAKGPGVTVGRSGASFGVVNYSAVDYWPLNTALYVIDFHGNDERFAYYLLSQFDFKRFNSGSAQPSLNRNFVHPAVIRVPPIAEQRAIARLLGALDDKIELNRQMNETLNWLITSLYADCLESTGRCGNFLDGVTVISGGTPKTGRPEYWDGAVPWISIKDLAAHPFVISTERHVTDAGIGASAASLLPDKAVILSARGTVGRVALTSGSMAVNQSCYALTSAAPYELHQRTLAAVKALRGRAHGSVFDTITRTTLEGLNVIALTDPERFDHLVASPYALALHNQQESQTLARLRDTLLPELISGRMRVHDAKKLAGAAV